MRTSKTQTEQRANFVINLYVGSPDMGISEVRRRLKAKYKHSMSYDLITKYRDAVKAQRLALETPAVVAVSTTTLPSGQPLVSMVSPGPELPNEFVEGLKHLVRNQFHQTASAGTIHIAATKEGDVSVSCELEQASP